MIHRIASHRTAPHRIASHRIASRLNHRVSTIATQPSHLIASQPIPTTAPHRISTLPFPTIASHRISTLPDPTHHTVQLLTSIRSDHARARVFVTAEKVVWNASFSAAAMADGAADSEMPTSVS